MLRRSAAPWFAAMVLAAAGCSAPDKPGQPAPQATTMGIAGGIVGGGIGSVSFDLQRSGVRFVILGADPIDWWRASKAVQDSRATGRSIIVRFDAGEGVMEADGTKPVFPVTGLEYDGRIIKLVSDDPGDRQGYVTGGPQRALARGVGLALDSQDDAARASLDEALAGRLDDPMKALALKTRGTLIQDQVETRFAAPTADSDRLLVQALDDLRQAKRLAPNDAETAYQFGEILLDLGAYDEALAAYRAMAARWSDEGFWTTIRIASVYRLRGQYPQSLGELDQLARDGAPSGMAYHYHRGWTLIAMGRNQDAVAEFTTGLEDQPDYEGAFDMRACALARLGRLREALDDEQTADRLFRRIPSADPTAPDRVFELRRLAGIEAQLRANIASGRQGPSEAACGGWWPWRMVRRARSPMVPPTLD